MTDTTNTTPEDKQDLVPGTPEYDAAMAAKFRDAKQDAGTPYPQTPEDDNTEDQTQTTTSTEGIPAKFIKADGTVDVEALAKSYTELERQRGSQKPEDKPEDATKGKPTEEDKQGDEAATQAGLDYNTLVTKIREQGDLDDADYAAFEKAGIPKETVQEYIALRTAAAERSRQEALDYIGGEEATQDLMQWAAQNLSETEIEGYNQMLAGPHWKAAVDTIKTLKASAKSSSGEPKLRTASGSSSGSATGYASRDEMRADMANPVYREKTPKGDQFRAEVQRKMTYAAWRRS